MLAGDRFCGRCGWAVPAHCPYGHPAEPGDAFCQECGAAVDRRALQLAVAGPPAQLPGAPAATAAAPAAAASATWQALAALPGPTPRPLPGPVAPGPSPAGPGGVVAQPGARRTGSWGSGARAAAVVAVLLVLGAAGLGVYAGATGGRTQGSALSSMPGAVVPSASRRATNPSSGRPGSVPSTTFPSTTEPPSTTVPPPSVPPATAPAAPAASALPGLGSLAGDWTGHGGGVHISADGQGQATFRAYRFCADNPTPPCDGVNGNTIVDGGHAQFSLTAAGAPGNATGRVTSSNDPQAFQPGFVMTVTFAPGDVMLVSSSPTAQRVAYCGPRAAAGACGA